MVNIGAQYLHLRYGRLSAILLASYNSLPPYTQHSVLAWWLNPRLKAISNGEVEGILEELKDEYSRCTNNRLKRLIGYIGRFFDAINYNDFKSKGYPIGSGEVESAHKYVPQKRMKLPGACWHPDTINPMLALRVLRANCWWDDYWNERTENKIAA